MNFYQTIVKPLIEKSEEIKNSELFKTFLTNFASDYSLFNKMLVFSQMQEAKETKGFNQWKAQWRVVKKWEKWLKIVAWMPKKIETESEEELVKMLYKVVTVFDISQTEELVA